MSDNPLISVSELTDVLPGSSSPPESLVVLDVRWTLAGSDPAAFADSHLPGAQFIDLDRDLAGAPGVGGRHPLPDPVDLQAVWRAAGISDGTSVVVYDGGIGMAAARAWWLLRWSGVTRVRVLDGGLPAWIAAGGATETGSATPRPAGTITVVAGAMPVVDADQAAELAASPSGVLIDARAAARYRGEIEPIDPVAGHIPGAVNLPITALLSDDGTFRSAEFLGRAFATAGLDTAGLDTAGLDTAGLDTAGLDTAGLDTAGLDTAGLDTAGLGAGSVARGEHSPRLDGAASCGSGITACQLILAGELAGLRLSLFAGSYSQWCALGRPVATGSS